MGTRQVNNLPWRYGHPSARRRTPVRLTPVEELLERGSEDIWEPGYGIAASEHLLVPLDFVRPRLKVKRVLLSRL